MKRLYIVLAIMALLTGLRFASYHSGFYSPEVRESYQTVNLTLPTFVQVPYEDVYTITGGGVALLDLAHDSSYTPEELNVLLTRIAARNYTVKYLREKGEMNKSLRGASTFIVPSPKEEYTEEEVALVEDFVRDNGTLLLLDDPSRNSRINILSLRFGIAFNRDYLYNTAVNDGNYRYVIFTNFRESNVTRGLNKVVLYVAESVTGEGLLLGDNNTYSSLSMGGVYSPVVEEGRVLAMGDVTFLTPPYNSAYDNNLFISNIADFVVSSTKVQAPEEGGEAEEEAPAGNETG